jgi:hypothetical protein
LLAEAYWFDCVVVVVGEGGVCVARWMVLVMLSCSVVVEGRRKNGCGGKKEWLWMEGKGV